MLAREIKIYRFLVIFNTIISIAITHQIILYNIEFLNFKIYFNLLNVRLNIGAIFFQSLQGVNIH